MTDYATDTETDQEREAAEATQAPPPTNGQAPKDPPGLRTRRPTGAVSFPLVLVEGEEKAGKSYTLASFSNSPRVGRTFVVELGEHRLDEYASLGRFELLEHNGTFGEVYDQLRLAAQVPSDPERPNVIGLDTGTALWAILCDWTDVRARNSKKGRAALENDPDAEVVKGMNLWNDAKARWRRVVDLLVAYPGVAVITARGKDVAVIGANGEPVPGQREWKVEAEKSLPSDATAWVRVRRDSPPILLACASLHVEVPRNGLALPREATLEHLVFDVLGAGGTFSPTNLTVPQVGIAAAVAKKRFLDYLAHQFPDDAERLKRAGAAWKAAGLEGKAEVTQAEYESALEAARPITSADTPTDQTASPTTDEPEDPPSEGAATSDAGAGEPGDGDPTPPAPPRARRSRTAKAPDRKALAKIARTAEDDRSPTDKAALAGYLRDQEEGQDKVAELIASTCAACFEDFTEGHPAGRRVDADEKGYHEACAPM